MWGKTESCIHAKPNVALIRLHTSARIASRPLLVLCTASRFSCARRSRYFMHSPVEPQTAYLYVLGAIPTDLSPDDGVAMGPPRAPRSRSQLTSSAMPCSCAKATCVSLTPESRTARALRTLSAL